MKNNLMAAAAGKLLAGLLILMLILFLPAGSLQYANGWLFLGILFIPMLIMGIVLKLKNPGQLPGFFMWFYISKLSSGMVRMLRRVESSAQLAASSWPL